MAQTARISIGRGDRPELIVLAKREANLRARGDSVASASGADTTSLSALLNAHGASLRPLFGLNEDRLTAHVDAVVAALAPQAGANVDSVAEPVRNLPHFYRVAASEDRLERLAQELLAHDLVEAAYIKPPGEPPEDVGVRRTEGLNDMQPDAADAPPATPSFVANQGYLAVAPGGVDATFAWTTPGGGGQKVKVIDCEWAWRFTHEDLTQNQGGVVAGTSSGNTDHGTAVLGVISGDRNAIGMTGITPEAVISASSFSDQSTAAAIKLSTPS